MTPLKPIENLRVRGVAAERYPLNSKCAHPDCKMPVTDPHHCFPRSQIASDSWFVEIRYDQPPEAEVKTLDRVIPHVTGLCRDHHNEVESHAAWIKLEDGLFVWYDREGDSFAEGEFLRLGALNPQPGSREGRAKRSRKKGEAKRRRRVLSIKVPDDSAEDGAGVWDDYMERVDEKIERLGLDPDRPSYHKLCDVFEDWLTIPDAASTSGEVS